MRHARWSGVGREVRLIEDVVTFTIVNFGHFDQADVAFLGMRQKRGTESIDIFDWVIE